MRPSLQVDCYPIEERSMQFPKFGLIPCLLLGTLPSIAQINAGALPPSHFPHRIASIPAREGRAVQSGLAHSLSAGRTHADSGEDRQAFLATQSGQKLEVTGVPLRAAEWPARRLPGLALFERQCDLSDLFEARADLGYFKPGAGPRAPQDRHQQCIR